MSTVLWALIRYYSYLNPVNKIADLSGSFLWQWWWTRRSTAAVDTMYLQRQQRAIENLEYQLIALTRELKKFHEEYSEHSDGKEAKEDSRGKEQNKVEVEIEGSRILIPPLLEPFSEGVEKEVVEEEEFVVL